MTRQEKRNQKDLTKLERQRELQKYRSAAAGPKAERPPRSRLDTRTEDWDEMDPVVSERKHKGPAPITLVATATEEGLVTGIGPGVCRVYGKGVVSICRSMPGLAVGDRVRFELRCVREILPRRTTLSRPDPRNPKAKRVLAANVDIVVNVVSVSSPPLRPGLIDRYLAAIQRGGAKPLLCVNKIDLVQDPRELEVLNIYRDLGVPVVLCSAATGAGIPELIGALAGLTCVFTGHSGVGKSSVLNAICPSLALATREVGTVDKRGKHTTTSSSLHILANETKLIDTPGIRQFGLWEIGVDELRGYFQEFGAFALRCTYADCTHMGEPGCQVQEAARRGDIAPARLASYLRIRETLLE